MSPVDSHKRVKILSSMMTRMNLEDATTSSEINQAQKKKKTLILTLFIQERLNTVDLLEMELEQVWWFTETVWRAGEGRSVNGSSVLQDRVRLLVLSGTPERMLAQQ